MLRRILPAALALLILAPGATFAQSDQEARLREALRRATADLRALQDGQARLQAEAAEAKAQRDRLQTENEQQAARIAEMEAKPPGPSPEMLAEFEGLRLAAAALEQQNGLLQTALGQWQAAYNEAANVARAKEAERLAYEASFGRARTAIDACVEKNDKLTAAAGEILKLYETPDFRSLIVRSQEPLLGLWRVRLETIVQEHEDRIREGRFHRAAFPTPAPPPASALPAELSRRPAQQQQRPAR